MAPGGDVFADSDNDGRPDGVLSTRATPTGCYDPVNRTRPSAAITRSCKAPRWPRRTSRPRWRCWRRRRVCADARLRKRCLRARLRRTARTSARSSARARATPRRSKRAPRTAHARAGEALLDLARAVQPLAAALRARSCRLEAVEHGRERPAHLGHRGQRRDRWCARVAPWRSRWRRSARVTAEAAERSSASVFERRAGGGGGERRSASSCASAAPARSRARKRMRRGGRAEAQAQRAIAVQALAARARFAGFALIASPSAARRSCCARASRLRRTGAQRCKRAGWRGCEPCARSLMPTSTQMRRPSARRMRTDEHGFWRHRLFIGGFEERMHRHRRWADALSRAIIRRCCRRRACR